ncbi:MAG: PAS domain S-box protein [Anaerolineales bacterium]|nr:PAS domain S-box protein [Anaerolineales bacterium]
MTEEKIPGSFMAGLRKKAEEQSLSESLTFGEPPTLEEAKRLLHELQVHQIELEMQNDELRQSQLDLEATRARYFDLYDLAPVGYLTLNENKIILEANITAATLLGVARTVLVKKALSHYILSEDKDRFYQFCKQFTGEGKSPMCELRLVRADGTHIWVQLRISSVKPGEYRITLSNINEYRRVEEELNKEKSVLKALGDSRWAALRANDEASYLDEVCRIIVEDCGFKMVWIGYAEEDKARTVRPVAQAGLGQDYLESVRITWDDKDTGRGPTGTAIRTGRTASCRNMLTDPDFAPWRAQAVQRGYASSLVLPLMGSSKPFGALTIYSPKPEGFSPRETSLLSELAEDLAYGITTLRESKAKQEAEAALRRNEAQLQTILNNITEGLVVADLNGDVVYWNPAAVVMHGLADANEGLRHLQDLGDTFELTTTAGVVLPAEEWPLARILRCETLHGYELRARCLDRDWQGIFSFSGTLARDPQGCPMLGIVVISDITEQKKAELRIRELNDELQDSVSQLEEVNLELERSNGDLQQFAYIASHDLQEPLRSVSSFVQLLSRRYSGSLDAKANEYIAYAVKGTIHMQQLLNDLLAYSRVGGGQLNLKAIDLAVLLERVRMNLQRALSDSQTTLLHDGLPTTYADELH